MVLEPNVPPSRPPRGVGRWFSAERIVGHLVDAARDENGNVRMPRFVIIAVVAVAVTLGPWFMVRGIVF